MKPLTKNARDFVESVVRYAKTDGRSQAAGARVEELLTKVTKQAQSEQNGVVETAVQLTEREKNDLSGIVQSIIGHPLTLDYRIRQDLLGGIKITVGDWIIDTTLDKQLENIRLGLI